MKTSTDGLRWAKCWHGRTSIFLNWWIFYGFIKFTDIWNCVLGRLTYFFFFLLSVYLGHLVVRSCYNNTYHNHTKLFGNFTRDTCTESLNLLECICDTDNCNGASFPWQPISSTLTLVVGLFIASKLFYWDIIKIKLLHKYIDMCSLCNLTTAHERFIDW